MIERAENMKKIVRTILICMAISMLCVTGVSAAKPTKATVNRAYATYVKKHLSSKSRYPYSRYITYDINRDGIPELFFEYMSGVRSGFKIYTYKNKKVVGIKSSIGVSRIYYKSSKKQICILTSGGHADNTYTYYKLNGTKLKKLNQYKSVSSDNFKTGKLSVKFYKNGKRITKRNFVANTNLDRKWNAILTYR